MILFYGLLIINLIIAIVNAISVGRNWSAVRQMSGMVKWSAYSVFIMSVIGFTQIYLIILLWLSPHLLPIIGVHGIDQYMVLQLFSDITFILIITAIIPSGLLMWYNSALHFWKNKNLGSGAILTWNTFAQVRNISVAVRGLPKAIRRIKETLSGSGNGKGKLIIIVGLAVVFVLLAGYFTTNTIVNKVDKTKPPKDI